MRCLSRSNNNTHCLDVWGHEQSVADCQNWCAIDYHAIKDFCGLSDELPEEWPGKNLSRIWRTPSARENGKLPSRGSENFPCQLNVFVDKLNFSGGDLARCRCYIRFTHEAIRHSRLAVFGRIISRIREAENLVHVWPAQVAVDEKHAIALLSQRQRIIGAGETLSFAGQSTGKK